MKTFGAFTESLDVAWQEAYGQMDNCKACRHPKTEHTDDGCEHSGCRCMEVKEATSKSMSMKCLECGRKFKSSSMLPSCPKCGGSDIDLAEEDKHLKTIKEFPFGNESGGLSETDGHGPYTTCSNCGEPIWDADDEYGGLCQDCANDADNVYNEAKIPPPPKHKDFDKQIKLSIAWMKKYGEKAGFKPAGMGRFLRTGLKEDKYDDFLKRVGGDDKDWKSLPVKKCVRCGVKFYQEEPPQKKCRDCMSASDAYLDEESLPHREIQRVFDETGDIGETEILCGVSDLKINGQGQVVSFIGEETERKCQACKGPMGDSDHEKYCNDCIKQDQGLKEATRPGRFTEKQMTAAWKYASSMRNADKHVYALDCLDHVKRTGSTEFDDVKKPQGLGGMGAQAVRMGLRELLPEDRKLAQTFIDKLRREYPGKTDYALYAQALADAWRRTGDLDDVPLKVAGGYDVTPLPKAAKAIKADVRLWLEESFKCPVIGKLLPLTEDAARRDVGTLEVEIQRIRNYDGKDTYIAKTMVPSRNGMMKFGEETSPLPTVAAAIQALKMRLITRTGVTGALRFKPSNDRITQKWLAGYFGRQV